MFALRKVFLVFLLLGGGIVASVALIVVYDRYGRHLGLPREFGSFVFFALSGVGILAMILAEKCGAHIPRSMSLEYLAVILCTVNCIYVGLNILILKTVRTKQPKLFTTALLLAVLVYGALTTLPLFIISR